MKPLYRRVVRGALTVCAVLGGMLAMDVDTVLVADGAPVRSTAPAHAVLAEFPDDFVWPVAPRSVANV